MFIEELKLQNFKSIESLSLPLTRLNIFIGPNSSGKSSVLQSLLILKKSLQNYPSNRLILRDDAYDFGNFEDVVTFSDPTRDINIHVIASKILPHGLQEDSEKIRFGYKVSESKDGISEIYFTANVSNFEIILDWRVRGNASALVRDGNKSYVATGGVDGLHFGISAGIEFPHQKNFNDIFANSQFTRNLFDQFHYVPYYRTATRYGAKLAYVRDDILASTPEELISTAISKLSRDTKLLDKTSDYVQNLAGKKIRTKIVDLPPKPGGTQIDQGVTLEFIKKSFSNAIANEGTGLNQVIILLMTLVGSPDNSIIAIDEPEIHLHPKAQAKLAKIMIDVIDRKKQLIFTTHSEHMLYPILDAISKGKLRKEEVSIYYFSQDENSLLTKVEKLEVNEKGQLQGGLKGFWDADLEAFSESGVK